MLTLLVLLIALFPEGASAQEPPTIVVSSQQLLRQARSDVYQGNLERARDGYLRLLFFFPSLTLARIELAYTLLLQQHQESTPERQEEINALLTEVFSGIAVEFHPYLQEIALELDLKLLAQARESLANRRYDEASEMYQVLLYLIPEWEVAKVGWIIALAAQGKRDRALEVVSEVDLSRLDPSLIETFRALGLEDDPLQFFFVPRLYLNTNLTQRTQRDQVQIPLFDNRAFELTDAVPDLGLGGSGTFGFLFTQPIRPRIALGLRSGVKVERFEDRRYDQVEFFNDGEVRIAMGNWGVTLGAITAARRVGHNKQEEGVLGWSARVPLTIDESLRFEVRLMTLYSKGFRAWHEITDRRVFQFQQQATKEIPSLGRGWIRISARSRDWIFRKELDNREVEFSASVTAETFETVAPTLQASVKVGRYKRRDSFFLVKRRDSQYQASLELCFRRLQLWGQRLCPQYRYTRNTSNIPLYDYQSHEVSVQFQPWIW